MRSRPVLLAAAALCACGPSSAPVTVVVAGVHDPGAAVHPEEGPIEGAADPAPRPGGARRFLRLAAAGEGGAAVRVAMEVPAAWGIRTRAPGERALRPCEVSPSSPSELFVATRRCSAAPCAEHEELAADLVSEQIVFEAEIESRASEPRGPDAAVTRLSGHRGSRVFSAFRFVRTGGDVPVACEAFLFEDEVRWLAAYEAACATLQIEPGDFVDGPEEIAPALDGKPRAAAVEAVAESALGYVSALGARDEKSAAGFLMTAPECVAAGGAPEECVIGATERRAELPFGFRRIPPGLAFGSADVRSPAALPGLVIATVKRRGDPCGPGYDVTLARAQERFAVVSVDPMPDPRLMQ
jgi:hypothetical protein